MNRIGAVGLLIASISAAHSAQDAVPATHGIAPFSGASAATLPTPWRVVGLPGNNVPLAQIDIVTLGPDRVMRLRTDHSYGTASHALPPKTSAGTLTWRWRLDQPIELADLRKKVGDDAALKVCAMFDMPLERLGFIERNLLRLARSASGGLRIAQCLPQSCQICGGGLCQQPIRARQSATTMGQPYA